MIDLDGLEEHLKEIIDDGRGDECHTKAKNTMLLVERLRQAEKDAARYRFVKQWSQSYSLNVYRKELWDEIIDREINNESRRIMK